ncbi:MAG: LCP family protein [Treponema sp.]|jgi:anionic cell wall polymer biosynthesis LytR-Cps2A-Psr (LCP) family protein|nr:LCP family protein [Treponema sp.]
MRKKTKIDASVLFLAVIVLILAAGVAAAVTLLGSDPIEESLSANRVVNTLFVIENNGTPLCTYVLMYYPATRRAAIFDIPGSVGLILTNIKRVDRIDTVYDEKKISVFKSEIESLLGVDIPFSIIINMDNLGKITDLLEGVEIFVPAAVNIYQEKPIMFNSGITRLDGDKAKLYITYELPEENPELPNFRRQRFFWGLLKRMGEQNEIFRNKQLARFYYSFFRTGMNRRSFLRFFEEFSKIDMDRINIQSVGGNQREISGQMLILPFWDGALIKDIVRDTLGSLVVEGAFNERVFTVEILNGTQVSGLAGRTAELIRNFGYDVISIGNADHNNYAKTVIIDHTGRENLVQDFGKIIRCTNIEYGNINNQIQDQNEMMNFEYQADFTLVIGRDFNERYVTGN